MILTVISASVSIVLEISFMLKLVFFCCCFFAVESWEQRGRTRTWTGCPLSLWDWDGLGEEGTTVAFWPLRVFNGLTLKTGWRIERSPCIKYLFIYLIVLIPSQVGNVHVDGHFFFLTLRHSQLWFPLLTIGSGRGTGEGACLNPERLHVRSGVQG